VLLTLPGYKKLMEMFFIQDFHLYLKKIREIILKFFSSDSEMKLMPQFLMIKLSFLFPTQNQITLNKSIVSMLLNLTRTKPLLTATEKMALTKMEKNSNKLFLLSIKMMSLTLPGKKSTNSWLMEMTAENRKCTATENWRSWFKVNFL
jgi:hypothetical protein